MKRCEPLPKGLDASNLRVQIKLDQGANWWVVADPAAPSVIGVDDFKWKQVTLEKDSAARIMELEKNVEVMKGMLRKLWYAPGMPGLVEGKESFEEALRALAL